MPPAAWDSTVSRTPKKVAPVRASASIVPSTTREIAPPPASSTVSCSAAVRRIRRSAVPSASVVVDHCWGVSLAKRIELFVPSPAILFTDPTRAWKRPLEIVCPESPPAESSHARTDPEGLIALPTAVQTIRAPDVSRKIDPSVVRSPVTSSVSSTTAPAAKVSVPRSTIPAALVSVLPSSRTSPRFGVAAPAPVGARSSPISPNRFRTAMTTDSVAARPA